MNFIKLQLQTLAAASSPAPFELQRVKPFVDHPRCAPYPCLNKESFNRTVKRAGAALHAEIDISNPGLAPLNQEKIVRTDFSADAAADAGFAIQLESSNPSQIDKAFQVNLPKMNRATPARSESACSGSAHFISFLTPDLEVYGVEPVKLSIMKELTAEIIRIVAIM